jgi:hypothetical protein
MGLITRLTGGCQTTVPTYLPYVLVIDILKELFLIHQRTREGCVLLLTHNLPFHRVPTEEG